jgi:serine/threonine protein kinase
VTKESSPESFKKFIDFLLSLHQFIQELHDNGIHHLDIKELNIVVDLSVGKPKIIDWGNTIVCPAVHDRTERLSSPKDGTECYRLVDYGVERPEIQRRESRRVLRARDLYALAITIISLVLKHGTSRKKSIRDCLNRHTNRPETLFKAWFESYTEDPEGKGFHEGKGFASYLIRQFTVNNAIVPTVNLVVHKADCLMFSAFSLVGVPVCNGFIHWLLEATRSLERCTPNTMTFAREWPNMFVIISVLCDPKLDTQVTGCDCCINARDELRRMISNLDDTWSSTPLKKNRDARVTAETYRTYAQSRWEGKDYLLKIPESQFPSWFGTVGLATWEVVILGRSPTLMISNDMQCMQPWPTLKFFLKTCKSKYKRNRLTDKSRDMVICLTHVTCFSVLWSGRQEFRVFTECVIEHIRLETKKWLDLFKSDNRSRRDCNPEWYSEILIMGIFFGVKDTERDAKEWVRLVQLQYMEMNAVVRGSADNPEVGVYHLQVLD